MRPVNRFELVKPNNDNLIELLVDRATEGLSTSRHDELSDLLRDHPDFDPEVFERAAAAVHLAAMPRIESLPDTLRKTLRRAAAEHFGTETD